MLKLRSLILKCAFSAKCFEFEKNYAKHNMRHLTNFSSQKHALRSVIIGTRSFCRSVREFQEAESNVIEEQEENLARNLKKEEIFKEISNGDPEKLKSLKILEFEMALMRNGGYRMPDNLTKEEWEELASKRSLNQKKKFLEFLRLNEFKHINQRQKMKMKHLAREKAKLEDGFHFYGVCGQTMFMRIYNKSVNTLLNLRRMSRPGLKIVLDCSYDEYMSHLNSKACAKQIHLLGVESRVHRFPAQIDLCNLARDQPLRHLMPWLSSDKENSFAFGVHEESYLDIYPREKLVYLSPDGPKDLNFDKEDIFVIGAYVDKGTGLKMSLAKAKKANIRCAKFPLDQYLDWQKGTKSLPLNTVTRILLDMAFYNDWNIALKNIPTRCIKTSCSSFHIMKDN